jgi:hypothetical protein
MFGAVAVTGLTNLQISCPCIVDRERCGKEPKRGGTGADNTTLTSKSGLRHVCSVCKPRIHNYLASVFVWTMKDKHVCLMPRGVLVLWL